MHPYFRGTIRTTTSENAVTLQNGCLGATLKRVNQLTVNCSFGDVRSGLGLMRTSEYEKIDKERIKNERTWRTERKKRP